MITNRALKTRLSTLAFLLTLALLAAGCGDKNGNQATEKTGAAAQVSGQVQDGLRVLTFDPADTDQHFTVYRGDYVQGQLTSGEPFTLKIASLNVDKNFPPAAEEKPYVKMSTAGSFRFSVGEGRGVIEVLDFKAPTYREVSSSEAADFIASTNPVIVDVRTPGEFAAGHLADATLIPVQEFQKRVGELADHKNDPVFVYCRSGNRSTVAAKILVDEGFTNVVNLRHGMVEWVKSGHPIVK